MKIVRALVPDLTIAVCKAALEHCQLDGMEAAHMLQAFKKDRHHELHELHKVCVGGKQEVGGLAAPRHVSRTLFNPTQTYAPEIQGNASSESDGSDSSADRCVEGYCVHWALVCIPSIVLCHIIPHPTHTTQPTNSRKKRKRSSKKKKSSKKHSKEDKKKRKKKHKRDASPGGVGMGGVGMGGAASQQQYGKYGIVKESDLENKRGDFMVRVVVVVYDCGHGCLLGAATAFVLFHTPYTHTYGISQHSWSHTHGHPQPPWSYTQVWAIEVAKVDPEVLPKHEERELFKTYMEDYNTATLPHKKYYNVAAYEAKQRAKAASKGQVGGGVCVGDGGGGVEEECVVMVMVLL